MITGNSERKIKQFLSIDRCAEGYAFTKPKDGEEFVGIPYQWVANDSMPFIEIRKNGIVTATINVSDVSEIEYEL